MDAGAVLRRWARVPESVRSRAVAAVLAVVLVGSVLGLGIAAAGNTASWSGQISINATPADDGSSYQYEINDLDAADNFTINVTGHTATEWDNVSGTSLSDGDTLSVDVAGNADPTGPSSGGEPVVEFTGNENTSDYINKTEYQTGYGNAIQTLVLAGDESQVYLPDGSSVVAVSLTGKTEWETSDYSNSVEDLSAGSGFVISSTGSDTTGTIRRHYPSNGSVDWSTGSADFDAINVTPDSGAVYVSDYGAPAIKKLDTSDGSELWSTSLSTSNGPTTLASDGDLVYGGFSVDEKLKAWYANNGTEKWSISISGTNILSIHAAAGKVFAAEVGDDLYARDSVDGSTVWSKSYDGGDVASITYDEADDYLAITNNQPDYVARIDPSDGSEMWRYSGSSIFRDGIVAVNSSDLYWTDYYGGLHKFKEAGFTEDPAIDIDDDGTDEASHSGTLSGTVTKEVSSLGTDDDTATVSTTAASVDVTVRLKERTQTFDPSIEVNGNWANHTGTLSDGSETSISTDESWILEGTNRINVSVGDGTLSADAPSPKVDLEFSHQAQDDQFVTYEAEKLTERYNISKTYASDRDTADVSVSFVQNVVSVRDVEISRNNSAWSTVPTKDYSLDSNTLTVDLGSADKDETVGLKINGSRVDVNNGSISVQRVSKFADDLNSSIRVESWNSDSYLDVTQADDGDELMFLADAEWTASEHNIYAQGGTHELHLPDAGAGQTADIRSVPITVDTNDNRARLSVTNTSSAEPAFQVRPAGDGSTAVTFTHEEAVDGTDYILWSQTDEIVRDSGTASSPLSLEDDDSAETLKFQVDDGGSSSSSGGGSAGITAGPISVGSDSSPLNSVPAVLLAWGLVEILLFVVDRRAFGSAVSIPNPVPGAVPVVGGSGWTVELPGGRGPLFYVGSLVSSLFVLDFLSGGEISGGIRGILEELGSSVGGVIAQVGPAIALIAVLGIAWIIYQRVRPRPIEVGGDDEE